MTACYVEFDPFVAAWLRELIHEDLIADGEVDTRDLRDIAPAELARFTQVHLCAGIGIWSLAARQAGIPDDYPFWSASFPCQPFSAAGARAGFADERHLWPSGFHLIAQCRPGLIIGEQVASPDGLQWLDLVSADLEGADYAFGAADLCAAGACVDFADSEEGAATLEWIRRTVESCPDPVLAAELRDFAAQPRGAAGYGPAHIRQRLYWMADAHQGQRRRLTDSEGRQPAGPAAGWQQSDGEPEPSVAPERLAHFAGRLARDGDLQRSGEHGQQQQQQAHSGVGGVVQPAESRSLPSPHGGVHRGEEGAGARNAEPERLGAARGVADTRDSRLSQRPEPNDGRGPVRDEGAATAAHGLHGADWIICTDGKARPTQPGILPLAHAGTVGNRVGTLRGAGNALHLETAISFLKAAIDL